MKYSHKIVLVFVLLSAVRSYSMEQRLHNHSSAQLYQKVCSLVNNNKTVTRIVGGVALAAVGYAVYRNFFLQPRQEKKYITLQRDSGSYQIEVRPPSERVKTSFIQALTDYQLNPRNYKIYALAKEYDICAFSNSREKRAVVNERWLQNDDSLTYVAYHESAHLKLDHSNSSKEKTVQELEADALACKTLLAKNTIRPICRQLLMLKINERLQKYTAGQLGHNVLSEYKNIEQILKAHNFSAATTHNLISADEVEIITTITGNNVAEQCNFVLEIT